jgi:hypothetical protein
MTPKNGFGTVSPSDVIITWDGHLNRQLRLCTYTDDTPLLFPFLLTYIYISTSLP